jgi:hypothetical protein
MSKMGRLAVEIDEIGVDYSQVDLDMVVAYQEAYKEKTGREMRLIEAIRELYGVK